MQRPAGRKGSKRRSRKSSVSYGYIKEMGLLQKIVDKMLFCMGRNSRIGVFLSIAVTAEVAALGSLMSTIMMLIKIGFPLQAVILLLLSVRIMNEREILIYNLKSIQNIGVTIFFLQMRGAKVFGAETGPKKWAINLGLLTVAPMAQLLILLGFSFSWKRGNTKREVKF